MAHALTTTLRRHAYALAIALLVSLAVSCSPATPSPTMTVSCPAAIEVESPNNGAVTVAYELPVVFGGAAPITLACVPASQSAFPVGTHVVTCTATDARRQTGQCSFNVRVRGVPRISATTFLAFGDSITYGVLGLVPTLTLSGDPWSYPYKLESLLRARYTRQTINIVNAGIPGEVLSEGGIARFGSTLSASSPGAVLLMEGSNDLFFYREAGITRGIEALETMISIAQGRGVQVFLATIPPQRIGGLRNRDRVARIIPQYNDQVRSLAMRRAVPLVDVSTPLEKNLAAYIGTDDLHPTEAGMQVIAETFFAAIRERLEVTATAAARVP